MSDHIISEFKNGVLHLRMNRPDKYNSFIRPMALELQDQLDRADSDENIRAVLLTGEGKAFCAGQDLAEAIDPNGPELTKIVQEHYNPIILKIRELSVPVVAAVNGVAAGAGANIALACDIVLAANSASFIQAFSKIGLIPDSGGTYTLPRLVGLQRASALMMLGDKVSAEDAVSMNMVYANYADDELMAEATAMAEKLAKMPTKALAQTKCLLNASFSNTMDEQLKLEDAYQTEAGKSHDYNEGVSAFLKKRKPNFKGN